MSASLGNVVYPRDWLEVAPPELLRFLYNKKLMKTRSFTWLGLPTLYNDYDMHQRVFFGKEQPKNPREKNHIKRRFEMSQLGSPKSVQQVAFDFAAMVSSVFGDDLKKTIEIFEKSGHLSKPTKEDLNSVEKRLRYARKWVEPHRIKVLFI